MLLNPITSHWCQVWGIDDISVIIMAKSVKLMDLKVVDLKRELEERDQDTNGRKSDLQERLRKCMQENGEDPESYIFEIDGGMNELKKVFEENCRSMKEEMAENTRSLEQKLIASSRNMEERLQTMDEKLAETSRSMDVRSKELGERSRKLEERLRYMEMRLDRTNMTDIDSVLQAEVLDHEHVPINEDRSTEVMVNSRITNQGRSEIHADEPNGSSQINWKAIIKPPTFDGKTSWVTYVTQFEAAAKANRWTDPEKATALIVALRGDASDVLQTIPPQEQTDYSRFVKRIEIRLSSTFRTNVPYTTEALSAEERRKPARI